MARAAFVHVGAGRPPNVATRVLIVVVRGYQAVRAGRPSPCRYWPTCSSYALEALEVHGAWRGGWLAARRLGRCHPWGGEGIDLVPASPASPASPESPERSSL